MRFLASIRGACALVLAGAMLTLSSCGGGGGTVAAPERRALPADFASRKAVNYSPYRTATSEAGLAAEVITPAMIRQDLGLLAQGGFTLIRLFDSSDKVARQTLQVIRADGLNMKVMLGAYVGPGDGAFNNAEIARTISLANEFRDIVVAVSVGNERMVSWSFGKMTPATIAAYIRTVKAGIGQPVTTDDNWAFFAQAYGYEQDPAPVLDVIDFVSMHTYPLLDTVFAPNLWDWRQASVAPSARATAMMDAAIERSRYEFSAVRANLDKLGFRGMPVVVGETGWKADPASHAGRTHPVNQKMYLDRLAAWKAAADGPLNVFWFEAFDEPWKQGDDKWGLFNKDRQARYAIQALYPASLWEAGTYTAADAVYVPTVTVRPAVTANRYTAYADTVTTGEARPLLAPWNAWENNTTATIAESAGGGAPNDVAHRLTVTPRPMSWGWGMALPLPEATVEDLSAFANGALVFSIRTTYPGKIEIGFLAGSGIDGTATDAYIAIGSGEYGYANDGVWREVSIPIAELRQRVAAADGVPLSRLDLGRVGNVFVIADRYARTGKAQGAGITQVIDIDAIRWTR